MASEYFLKIDGIDGDSAASKHKDEIELLSWSWGESTTGSQAFGSGGGAGKVAMRDLQFTSTVGRQSPRLLLAGANGRRIKQAVLKVDRRGGKDQTTYLQLTFSDVGVAAYETGASGDGDVVDQVALNFAKVEMELFLQDASGKQAGSVKAGWDLKGNKAT